MTERLKRVLDWFYLGPNHYANQYFRQIVATNVQRDERDDPNTPEVEADEAEDEREDVAAAR